jgi:hypothetical protein
MEAERLEVEECLVDGCLALKTVDCLMEKCYYEAGTEDVLIPTRRSSVIPETLALITGASRAHRICAVWQS